MTLLVTRVRSAMRAAKRIKPHMGPTRPFHVYLRVDGQLTMMNLW